MNQPVPRNERRRLAHLAALEILDTDPSDGFDRVCSLAHQFFGCSAAMVSFVDAERQWLKAKVGTSLIGSSRAASFCSHTILSDELLVVPDALLDDRSKNSPLVSGEPGIRFYAGAPIGLSPGFPVGAVCIVDREPRRMDASGRIVLKQLAAVAVSELKLMLAAGAYRRRS